MWIELAIRIGLAVLGAVVIAVFPLAWWLTSPRRIGRLAARRLGRLRTAARALYPMLIAVPEPTAGIIVVNRADPASLPLQRCVEPSLDEMAARWPAAVRGE